jgi:tRNA threonylcarbamoyl adenosine modification protein YeaZ
MTRYALGLHTTTPDLALVLQPLAPAQQITCQTWALGRDLSIYLHSHLQTFLGEVTWRDLAWLAVAQGPGSFTGTRMGVVTARTLAQQLNLPLFAVSTLAAAAWWVGQAQANTDLQANIKTNIKTIAVELPAQQGQIYGGIYQIQPVDTPHLTPQHPDQLFDLDDWQALLHQIGSPYLRVGASPQADCPFPDVAAQCQAMLQLAHQAWQQGASPHWSQALPFYGMSPV